MSLFKFIKPGT